MKAIHELLELKGDKDYLKLSEHSVLEGGGEYKGHYYFITFHDICYRCGYISVDKEKYCDREEFLKSLDVHAGIKFIETEGYISYYPLINLKSSLKDEIWIGFDAGHAGDLRDFEKAKKIFPKAKSYLWRKSNISYEYMVEQCKQLIDQVVDEK